MKDTVTIVTAFVDIGRGNWVGTKNDRVIPPYIQRHTDTYLERFEKLTKLNNPIICFTESKFFDKIKGMRDDIVLIDIDNIWDDHTHLTDAIKKVQSNPSFIQFVNNPAAPEYWSEKYVAINLMKSHFCAYSVEHKLCATDTVAWIDFGYCREDVYCPEGKTWVYDTEDKINLFCQNNNVNERPIFDIIKTGEVYIQGCHIVSPARRWSTLKQLINDNLTHLFTVGLVDDDQTLLLMAYRVAPELFKLESANPSNWFTIFEGRCE